MPTIADRPFSRRMYSWEVAQARLVFDDQLDYMRVRIHESTPLPDRVNAVGVKLKVMLGKMKKPEKVSHNAITWGNHCIFPVRLPSTFPPPGHPDHYKICWLIHELTHAWQFQKMGWPYIIKAVLGQFRHGYDYGGEKGLLEHISAGLSLSDFNLEQQGDIARHYYERVVQNKNISAWQPFVERDIQRRA